MGIKILPDGEILDKTIINNNKVHCFKLNNRLLTLNDLFNKYKGAINPGLFINNSLHPFITKDVIIDTAKGRYVISTIDDFIKFILDGNDYKADDIIITKSNINIIKKYITDVSKSNVFLIELLRFLEADIMINDNVEHEILFNDVMGISKHVLLENNLFKVYDSIASYIVYIFNVNIRIPELNDFLINLQSTYDQLRNEILSSLTNNYLYNSINIKLTNMSITVTEYASPSSRRYIINMDLLNESAKEDNEECTSERIIESLNDYEEKNAKNEESSYGGENIYS